MVFKPEVVNLENGKFSKDDCVIYDSSSLEMAQVLSRMFRQPDMPRPFGVFYKEDRTDLRLYVAGAD